MKPTNHFLVRLVVSMISLFTISSFIISQEYRLVDMNFPSGNFFPSGINSQGQVCGSALVDEENFINHAFRRETDGTFTMLTLGENGESATASAINDHGHVLGNINTKDFTTLSVIWLTDSTYRILDQPEGFTFVFPKDLNNNGEAVGHTLTDPPTPYYWDIAGTIHELPHSGTGAEAVALNNNGNIVGRVFDSAPFLRTPKLAYSQGNSLPMLWQQTSDPFGGGEREFLIKELPTFRNNGRATDINDNNIISGESSISESVTHAFAWVGCEPIDISAIIGGTDINELNGSLSGLNNENFATGSQEYILGAGGPTVGLGIFVDLNSDPPIVLDTRQTFDLEPGQALPLTTEINDRFLVLGLDHISIPNFVVGLDANATPSSGELGLGDFSSFAEASSELQQFIINQSIFPMFFFLKSGVYAEDSWTFDKWSVGLEFRSEGDGTALINQINIPEGTDATIQPRFGFTYDVKGIKTSGDLSFSGDGDVSVEDLQLNGDLQNLFIEDPSTFNLNKLIIDKSVVTVDGNMSLFELVLNGIVKGKNEDFEITIKNNGSSVVALGENLPTAGAVQMTDKFSGTGQKFTHQVGGENHNSKDNYVFPNGMIDEEDEEFHPLILAFAGLSTLQLSVSSTSIRAPNLNDTNTITDGLWKKDQESFFSKLDLNVDWSFFRNEEDFVREKRINSIKANVRLPLYQIPSSDDPAKYRLLRYDCNGNFLEIAGSYLPDSNEPQTEIMHTGLIDGVLNLTHTDVTIDSCNYFVVASGSISTGIHDPLHFKDFGLLNYPNPMHNQTKISYTLPSAASVDIGIYSISGQLIERITKQNQPVGQYELNWEMSKSVNYPSGGYLLKMIVLDSSTHQMWIQSKLILIQ